MKALVTGANGLIGANLVRVLLDQGVAVRALVRSTSNISSLQNLPVEIVYGDVTDGGDAIAAAVKGIEVVFHAAMYFSYAGHTAEELAGTALSGTANVLRAASRAGVRRVVVTSSSAVFGYSEAPLALDERSRPAQSSQDAPYVAAKIRQDEHALTLSLELGLEVVLVCPTISVGPHGSTLGPSNGMIVSYLNDPWRCTYPGGCNIVSVRDVAQGHWLAAQEGRAGEHYILASENLEWRDVHRLIGELTGVKGPNAQLNHSMSYVVSAADEFLSWMGRRPALNTREQARMVGRYYWYRPEKAATLGYQPRPARIALAEAISWLASSPHISREVRTTLCLHPDVYTARALLKTGFAG